MAPPFFPPSGPRSTIQISGGDDVEIVLDDDHRVAARDEPVDDGEQAVDVGWMEAGRRLVHDVYVAGPGHLGGEFEALRFAAREGGQRLAEAQIAHAYVDQELQAASDSGASFSRIFD